MANEQRFTNYYVCPRCRTRWTDEWTCMCNDRCPKCNLEVQPCDSHDNDPEPEGDCLALANDQDCLERGFSFDDMCAACKVYDEWLLRNDGN
jgi:hypothetical protein